ncbi:MAG: WD40/YVTN/BNR-like repeat-containing protein, partial [Crocinitomicaceae bacterium]
MKNVHSPSRELSGRTFRNSVSLILGVFLTLNVSAQTPWVDEMLKENANFNTIKQSFDQEWSGKQYVKGKGWKQYQRWQAFWETRLLPDGSFPNFKNAFHNYQQYMTANGQAKSLQNAGNWSPMGPFTYNNTDSWSPGLGRVNFIVEDPNNASIIYLGAPAGGVWKSTDSGATWTPLGDELAVMGVSSIAISAANSNVLYLATGDADGGDTYSIGVLKSTDAGQTWAEVGNVSGNLRDIVVDPADEDIVYVASNGGVYKTIDGGANWAEVLTGSYRDIELKPGTASTIYAATSSEVRYSTNSGATWTLATAIPGRISRIRLAVTPANNAYVYVFRADAS